MAEIVLAGLNKGIVVADRDTDNINGSSPSDTGISLTNFSLLLYKDTVEVADETTITGSPYFFSLDNVADGRYRVNITLTTPGNYELHIKHSSKMKTWRGEQWDVQFLVDEMAKASNQGNVQLVFTKAGAPIGGRNVQTGYIDYVTVSIKRSSASNWSSPVWSETLYYWYENLGDKNPIKVGAST